MFVWISREAQIKDWIGEGQSRVGAKGKLRVVDKWRWIQANQVRLGLRRDKTDWEAERYLVIMRSNEASPVRSQWFFLVRKVQRSRIQNVSKSRASRSNMNMFHM